VGKEAQASLEQLRRIESFTDSALAHLGADALLEELLDRVRDFLHADTVALLVFDEDTGRLAAMAARGLEEEVRQGFRISIGEGFAGRVAAEKQPVILDRVDKKTVRNALLRTKRLRSLLGVPLLAHGELLGVLHVGSRSEHAFDQADAQLLQLVADRVAMALLARRSESERTAAVALQHSLVPERLADIAGLELASRYVTADDGGVGGDWYDLFLLPSGHICVVMGDVAGRGLQAAVVMGRLRSTVRAYAMETVEPAAVLERVDRKLSHFEPYEMATILFAVLDPSLATMRLSTAGHPAPLLALPDAPTRFVDMTIDPPVGLSVRRSPRHTTTMDLPTGGLLCSFTDGLVERRQVPIDDRLDMLRRAVSAEAPETVCATVMTNLIGADPTKDDTALLVLRRTT
jgi:serine phosphatase RsbU (regulator of sigma subunit)